MFHVRVCLGPIENGGAAAEFLNRDDFLSA
jgi:hypothetical protein